MGLLSKIKSIFGFGGAKQSSTPNAKQKGQHSQKFEKKPGEKRSKRNNKQRSEGRRPEGQSRPGHRERRENFNSSIDANRGPTRSRSAKPRRVRASSETGAVEPSQQTPSHEQGRKPREGGKSRGPRIDHNLRNTPAHRERPGGAFTPEQLKAYAAAHAAWDPASYVVPEAEGKKRFVDFGLPGEILHAVADLEFQYCTPIQAQSLEFSLEGKNVAGRAQTGTGKTAAFLIAVLTRYLRTPERRNLKPGTPRALILAPTRELVIQICKDAEALGKYCGDVRSLAVYGGMDYDRQRHELEDAPVDILVATPGRLIDFVRNHIINLRLVDTLVIDEADRMLDMGFIPDVRAIVNRLPDRDRRCTMLYSATLNDTVMNLAAMWMRDPIRVEVESETMTTETIRQVVYIARSEEKFKLLYNHLVKYSDARTIIFCNRKFTTERICENLRRRGIPCEMLSGDVNQVRRLKILEAFRAGDVRTVVATDVAGRGIHVDDIAFVVNYDFPYEPEDYVHRIGRTGRAGHTGTAISFADEDESFIIPDIEAYIKEPLKCVMPEEWMYAEIPAPAPRHKRGERKGAPKAVATEAPVA
ncbi:MAG: DEAD/DEAH box helicase, partial [bacterium]|nr:DEAD/DEAH box helicase [bacterium]